MGIVQLGGEQQSEIVAPDFAPAGGKKPKRLPHEALRILALQSVTYIFAADNRFLSTSLFLAARHERLKTVVGRCDRGRVTVQDARSQRSVHESARSRASTLTAK